MYLKYHCLKECKHEGDHEKNELLRYLRVDTFGKTLSYTFPYWSLELDCLFLFET